MADNKRTLTDAIQNGGNSELRIFSFMQQRHCSKPYFMTYTREIFPRPMHNGDDAKLKVFRFILQRKRVQPHFMTVL